MPRSPDRAGASAGARRLGLGTVQFGLDYGVTNAAGRVSEDDVARILETASSAGIDVVDTAALYGESEAVLGRAPTAYAFRVVSKTAKFSDLSEANAIVERFRATLAASLARVKRPTLDALLVHQADDLLGSAADVLWREMEAAKARGLVKSIGVSIYDGHEIDELLARYPLDIVQLPMNAIDHRLIDGGQLDRLAARGIEVHARSALLQGILSLAPEKLDRRFEPLRPILAAMRERCSELGLSLMGLLLGAVLKHHAIARLIVGVTSVRELSELIAAADEAVTKHAQIDYTKFRISDPRLLNPALWPALT